MAKIMEWEKEFDRQFITEPPFMVKLEHTQAAAIKAFFCDQISAAVIEALQEPNSLLRSAYAIAERGGIQTNWEAFKEQLKIELEREHKIIYPANEFEGD